MLALFLSSGLAHGGQPPTFLVHTTKGDQPTGSLEEIAADWSIKVGGLKPVAIPGKELLSFRLHKSPLPPHPLTPHLVLTSGDRIPIDVKKGIQFRDSQFQVHPAAPLKPAKGATLNVPSSAVAMLWLQAPQGVSVPERFLRQLLKEDRSADLVLLQNGDLASGIFVELDSTASCKLKFADKFVVVPFDRIALIAFNPLFLLNEPPKQSYGHLVLDNGCRLSLLQARVDTAKQVLSGTTLFQAEVQAALKQVASLDLYQGAGVYLSDLKPAKYDHTPFFGLSWPFVPDGSPSGAALKLGGDTYDKGLGLHSGSTITYTLDGSYQWFEALVGLDETGTKLGGARIGIWLDGKEQDLKGKNELNRGSPPVLMRLKVGQAKSLTLKVEYGQTGNVGGCVNWANARLIKS